MLFAHGDGIFFAIDPDGPDDDQVRSRTGKGIDEHFGIGSVHAKGIDDGVKGILLQERSILQKCAPLGKDLFGAFPFPAFIVRPFLIARDGNDGMSPADERGYERTADMSGGADDGNFHIQLPKARLDGHMPPGFTQRLYHICLPVSMK